LLKFRYEPGDVGSSSGEKRQLEKFGAHRTKLPEKNKLTRLHPCQGKRLRKRRKDFNKKKKKKNRTPSCPESRKGFPKKQSRLGKDVVSSSGFAGARKGRVAGTGSAPAPSQTVPYLNHSSKRAEYSPKVTQLGLKKVRGTREKVHTAPS